MVEAMQVLGRGAERWRKQKPVSTFERETSVIPTG
jgi:hypothetical protein